MSTRDATVAKHDQVLAIIEKKLDPETVEIIRSALRADERMAIIRDTFLEGRDHEAVQMIRDLVPQGFWGLLPTSCPELIPPGNTAQITAHPQIGEYRPRYLLVSRTCADYFMINEIRVGNRSQLHQAGDIPADIFAVDSPTLDVILDEAAESEDPDAGWVKVKIDRTGSQLLGIRLDLETVGTSMDLVLIVSNLSVEPQRFRAAWLGEAKVR